MAVDSIIEPEAGAPVAELVGERIALAGRLFGVTRRDAAKLICPYGGELVDLDDPAVTIVVIGDGEMDLAGAVGDRAEALAALQHRIAAGSVRMLRESQLWEQLGLVDEGDVRRLYTPAILAELLGVPLAAIRRWEGQGALLAVRRVHRLPYFDFQEVAVARRLAELLNAGCSLRTIDRRLAELSRLAPDLKRPMADPAVVVQGRRVYLRRGDDLAEPCGQLLLDFGAAVAEGAAGAFEPDLVSIFVDRSANGDSALGDVRADPADALARQLEREALDWEDEGELDRAAEAYRTLLMAAGPRAEIHFALADVLYRSGDLSAARERYYAALELDEEYVEARTSLGCVLAETGELELAAATFEGALVHYPDFADAHFHLANALDRLDRPEEAGVHFRRFLALAPESPWVATARDRLAESRLSVHR